jgi:hypothetical protein
VVIDFVLFVLHLRKFQCRDSGHLYSQLLALHLDAHRKSSTLCHSTSRTLPGYREHKRDIAAWFTCGPCSARLGRTSTADVGCWSEGLGVREAMKWEHIRLQWAINVPINTKSIRRLSDVLYDCIRRRRMQARLYPCCSDHGTGRAYLWVNV